MFRWKLWCRSVLITINDSVTADSAALVSRHHGLDDCMWSVCWGRGGCMIGSPSSFFARPMCQPLSLASPVSAAFWLSLGPVSIFTIVSTAVGFILVRPPPPPPPPLCVFLPFLCVCKLLVSSSLGIKITCTNGEWIASYYVTALP